MIRIDQLDLTQALKMAKTVIPTGNGLPVFKCVSIEEAADPGRATIIATTLDQFLSIDVEAIAEEDDVFVLPHKELTILTAPEKNGPGGFVSISDPPNVAEMIEEAEREYQERLAKYEKSRQEWPNSYDPGAPVKSTPYAVLEARIATPDLTGTLQGLDPETWPELPEIEWAPETYALDLDKFVEEVEWVSRAMSPDEARPHLNGMLFSPDKIVCTDGHRLHLSSRSIVAKDAPVEWTDALIPAACVNMLLKLLKLSTSDHLLLSTGLGPEREVPDYEGSQKMKIVRAPWIAATTGEGWTLISKLVEARFPPYEKVIPRDESAQARVTFDMAKLSAATRRLQKLGKGEMLTVEITPDHLGLSSGHSEVGMSITVPAELDRVPEWTPPSTYSGDRIAEWRREYYRDGRPLIAFNGRYVLEAFDKQSGDATFRLIEHTDAVKFEYEGRLGVLMPMRL